MKEKKYLMACKEVGLLIETSLYQSITSLLYNEFSVTHTIEELNKVSAELVNQLTLGEKELPDPRKKENDLGKSLIEISNLRVIMEASAIVIFLNVLGKGEEGIERGLKKIDEAKKLGGPETDQIMEMVGPKKANGDEVTLFGFIVIETFSKMVYGEYIWNLLDLSLFSKVLESFEKKKIIPCPNENCKAKLRIPIKAKKIRVYCPICKEDFIFNSKIEDNFEHKEAGEEDILDNFSLIAMNMTWIHYLLKQNCSNFFPKEEQRIVVSGLIDVLYYYQSGKIKFDEILLALRLAKVGRCYLCGKEIIHEENTNQVALHVGVKEVENLLLNFILQIECLIFFADEDIKGLPMFKNKIKFEIAEIIVNSVVSRKENLSQSIKQAISEAKKGNIPIQLKNEVESFVKELMESPGYKDIRCQIKKL